MSHIHISVNPGFAFRRIIGTDSVKPDCADTTAPTCRMGATIVPYMGLIVTFGGEMRCDAMRCDAMGASGWANDAMGCGVMLHDLMRCDVIT